MYRLAKLGFSQSYTYFAWRNSAWEITKYFTELTQSEVREFFRPNLWPNTPDILTEYLQTGGRPAFAVRLVLAATLGASYGIYGPAFELCENRPREAGSEEYLNSEKYEIRHWDRDDPQSLQAADRPGQPHPAGEPGAAERPEPPVPPGRQRADPLLFQAHGRPFQHHPGGGQPGSAPHPHRLGGPAARRARSCAGGAGPGARPVSAMPATCGRRARNFIELDPQVVPAHIFRLRRKVRTEQDFDYFL